MSKSVDTDAILSTKETISSLSRDLSALLQRSEAIIQSLSTHWTGPGANATLGTFSQYMAARSNESKENFFRHEDFLKTTAKAGYEETEKINVSKADKI